MSHQDNTTDIVNGVLKGLVLAGMVGTIVVAPNAMQLCDSALKMLDKRERRQAAKRALAYMKYKRLIEYTELEDGQLEVRVTEKGKKRVSKVNFDNLSIKKPRKWDHKWRLVMFDIPEKRRKSRSALSMKLKRLGFYQLQKSAWAHAYPCSLEVELVKQVFEIRDSDIIVAEILSIDHEYKLKQHFKIHD